MQTTVVRMATPITTYSADSLPDREKLKGAKRILRVGDLDVEVRILDTRHRFGHLDCLVSPVAGSGETYVEYHRLS